MQKIFALFLMAGLIAISQPSASSEPVSVNHREIAVIDGDTIQIGKTVYQLAGIDAPELGQTCDHGGHLWLCGLDAAYRLRKQLELEPMPIRCFVQPRPGLLPLAACMIGDAEVSVILLKSGYVTALKDGPPHYAAAEHIAKRGALGIWGGVFVNPPLWRLGKRLPNEHNFKKSSHPTTEFPWKDIEERSLRPDTEHAACIVKGGITTSGEHLYYGPLDRAYMSVNIDLKKGERFFCGDEEARHAGFRRLGEPAAKVKVKTAN